MSAGMALLQVATGTFFAITGYRKVFRPEVREQVVPFIMQQAHVSKHVAQFVTIAELLGGIALLTGVLAQVASLGLLILMHVAYWTTIWPKVYEKDHAEHWSKLASNAICTPEFQLIVILTALTISGGY